MKTPYYLIISYINTNYFINDYDNEKGLIFEFKNEDEIIYKVIPILIDDKFNKNKIHIGVITTDIKEIN